MSTIAEQLRTVRLFAAVSPEQIEAVARRAAPLRIKAGEWLFHEGDPADTLFVVVSGSIELFPEAHPAGSGSLAGPGESIGELSLLTGQPRSLAARARRDSELVCVTRADFDELLDAQPGFAVELVRVLGERLRRVAPPAPPPRPPRVIAVVGLHDDAPVREVVDALEAQFATLGSVERRRGGVLPAEELDRIEAANDRVLLEAISSDPDDEWTGYCLRQADRIVGVASRGAVALPARTVETVRGCDIAFNGQPGVEPDLRGWLDLLTPRTVYVLRRGSADGVARMARRLAGVAVGVVLSGGGARGIAHIGVFEELTRCGVVIDRIGAVSMGAAVGSLFAEMRPAEEVADIVEHTYIRDTPLRGRTIPVVALSRGIKGYQLQHKLHGERRIEGLDIPFFCVSSDLVEQRPVVHRRGLVAVAVSASQALPAFVPPVQHDARMLIDGAVFSNLPVEPMRETGEGPVIAVDVSGQLPPPRAPKSKLPFLRRWIVGPAAEWAPPITETILRSILLGNVASDAAARERADVVIQPRLRGVATMRFRDLEGIRRLGREAVAEAAAAGTLAPVGIAGQAAQQP